MVCITGLYAESSEIWKSAKIGQSDQICVSGPACYFDYIDDVKTNNINYTHWKLNEDSPVGDQVFRIETEDTQSNFNENYAFDFLNDEIWEEDEDILFFSPSDASFDCSE
jgi:hypothetical protein